MKNVMIAVLLAFGIASPVRAASAPHKLETLTDRCSQSVSIVVAKIYHLGHEKNGGVGWIANAGKDEPIELKRESADGWTPWTPRRTVELDVGRFDWYCGPLKGATTKEQSTCPPATLAIRARLGPNRLLQVECWSGN